MAVSNTPARPIEPRVSPRALGRPQDGRTRPRPAGESRTGSVWPLVALISLKSTSSRASSIDRPAKTVLVVGAEGQHTVLRAVDLEGVDLVAGMYILPGQDQSIIAGVEVDLGDALVRAPVRRAVVDREKMTPASLDVRVRPRAGKSRVEPDKAS